MQRAFSMCVGADASSTQERKEGVCVRKTGIIVERYCNTLHQAPAKRTQLL